MKASNNKTLIFTTFLCLSLAITSNTLNAQSVSNFSYGADISWLSMFESWGYKFFDENGEQQDCMEILQDYGIDALRFRVWVNPEDYWSSKKDVVYLAQRAHALGYRIMIDFHYSDDWADPAKQTKPSAWLNHTLSQLIDDIYNHTYDVLDTLRSVGITPEWVQIGNETNNGMLWPTGKASVNMSNFAQMVKSGYQAAKDIDSSIKTIIHLSNGHDNSLYRWIFDGLKSNGVEWDIIGLSVYPRWAELSWEEDVRQVKTNMKDLLSRYDSEVMVTECGYEYDEPKTAYNFLSALIKETKTIGGLGVFYWEPECYNMPYSMGAWNPKTKQPTKAMLAFKESAENDITTADTALKVDKTRVRIYPNPLYDDSLTIELQQSNCQTDITIYSLYGQTVRTENTATKKVVINNLHLSTGVYFVQIQNQFIKQMRKLVVQ